MDSSTPNAKIAFIYPAKFNLNGANSPTLNFYAVGHRVAMSVGISFVDLDPNKSYIVSFTLTDSDSHEVVTSVGMNGIPSDQIDPRLHTSFLSASFYFDVSASGTYRFSCQLIDMLHNNGNAFESKDIYFNVIDDEAACHE